MLTMQMPVFLTEPPQIPSNPSPSPRKQKKSRVSRTNGYQVNELSVALVESPNPRRSRSPRVEKKIKDQDTARSVGLNFLRLISHDFIGLYTSGCVL